MFANIISYLRTFYPNIKFGTIQLLEKLKGFVQHVTIVGTEQKQEPMAKENNNTKGKRKVERMRKGTAIIILTIIKRKEKKLHLPRVCEMFYV